MLQSLKVLAGPDHEEADAAQEADAGHDAVANHKPNKDKGENGLKDWPGLQDRIEDKRDRDRDQVNGPDQDLEQEPGIYC